MQQRDVADADVADVVEKRRSGSGRRLQWDGGQGIPLEEFFLTHVEDRLR